jgi:PleD family two-component response regulator
VRLDISSQVLPDATTRGKKARILVVDDDPEVTDLLSLVLEDSGLYHVTK